jgi:hypothetical protein
MRYKCFSKRFFKDVLIVDNTTNSNHLDLLLEWITMPDTDKVKVHRHDKRVLDVLMCRYINANALLDVIKKNE